MRVTTNKPFYCDCQGHIAIFSVHAVIGQTNNMEAVQLLQRRELYYIYLERMLHVGAFVPMRICNQRFQH
jgi:hypothetical protein